jgi:hypothetical protein
MSEQLADVGGGQLSFFAPKVVPALLPLPDDIDAEFAAFWEAYPARQNNPKKPARASYARQRKTASAAEILAGLARYIFSSEPKYRPMAVTWLNQRRWTCALVDLSADEWGLGEFLAALPESDAVSAASYDVDTLYGIMLATGWPETWRGDLDPLNAWLRDGYDVTSVAKVIGDAVAASGPRSTLMAFDGLVRARAVRFDAVTFRYR